MIRHPIGSGPRPGDRGSTLPLILAFVVVALMLVAGSVAAGQAFVQQRDLQAVCDGAASAAAAGAADLDRQRSVAAGDSLRFAGVQAALAEYLARESARQGVAVEPALSGDAETITLTCTQTRPLAFGAMFGKADGIRHVATSAARAPIR
jgi:uncharacterized membrane protein